MTALRRAPLLSVTRMLAVPVTASLSSAAAIPMIVSDAAAPWHVAVEGKVEAGTPGAD
jgi:hypothetical protein